jgi:hypothetical protein
VKWLAVLLSLASLGGNPAPGEVKPRKHCAKAKVTKQCKAPKPKKKQKPTAKRPAPSTPAAPRSEDAPRAPDAPAPVPGAAQPVATATPEASATPAPPGTYPSRTNVDLDEWFVRSSYRALAAGRIEFNVNNLGEDDHDFSVRGGGREYGTIDLAPGETDSLTLDLWLGSYTLYCSLPDHEAAGMSVNISVR